MSYLSIKNWEKFQHYKDRSPPWIKLHREVLDDYEFSCLQDASKAHLMLFWLLASQLDNKIPNDPAWLKRRLNLSQEPDLKELITKGYLVCKQDPSSVLAKRSPETETETETETESTLSETTSRTPRKPKNNYSEKFETSFWKPYPTDPIMSKADARAQFKKLSEEDQDRACRAVPLFAAWGRKQINYRMVHACRFLSQRRFDGFLDMATKTKTETIFVSKETPRGQAWRSWNSERSFPLEEQNGGYLVPVTFKIPTQPALEAAE